VIRVCSDCSVSITQYSRTGRCLGCSTRARFADPAWRAKHKAALVAAASTEEYRQARREGTKKRFADPSARKAHSDARKAALARNPEQLEQLQEYAATVLRDARAQSKVDWVAHHRARAAEQLSWCPPERLDEYRKLRATRGVGAAEAKRMILADIAAADRKRLAAMTPFERNMERIRMGAGITIKPDLRKADPAFTLGGIASGAL